MQRSGTKVPVAAAWLGGLGAVPFVALAGATVGLDGAARAVVGPALVAYGAAILSFLGGIHWGLAVEPAAALGGAALRTRLAGSVVPSLVGWAALLVPPTVGLPVLAAAFAAMLAVDLRAARIGAAPAWYPALRLPLSVTVVASLLLATFALRTA